MSASLTQPNDTKLRKETYFEWSGRLWYVVDVDKDGETAFVEDCKTMKVRWIKCALFEDEMKEVKPIEC